MSGEYLNLPRPAQLAAVHGAAERGDECISPRHHDRCIEIAGEDSGVSKAKLAVGYLDVSIDCRFGKGPGHRQARHDLPGCADTCGAEKR